MINTLISRYRLSISKTLLLLIIILLLLSNTNISRATPLYNFCNSFGFFLVLAGVLGRVWSSLYIEGNKTNNLITKGIYALTRNPLYFFSFLLLSGYCLVIKSIIIAGISALIWILIYPKTIKHEEEKLLKIHKDDYLEYYKGTPKIIPKLSLFNKAEKKHRIDISINNIERVLVESFGFLLFFEIIRILSYMHYSGVLPTLFSIY